MPTVCISRGVVAAGASNWKPRTITPGDDVHVLTVDLQPAVDVPRSGAWLGAVLQEIGWAI
jgi:hypothetical protein